MTKSKPRIAIASALDHEEQHRSIRSAMRRAGSYGRSGDKLRTEAWWEESATRLRGHILAFHLTLDADDTAEMWRDHEDAHSAREVAP